MGNSKIKSKIIFSQHLSKELETFVTKYPKGKVFLVTEETVDQLWIQDMSSFFTSRAIEKLVVSSGEENKKIDTVLKIWKFLSENGGDRKSLLINIGGGMLTDLAGFAASTFKRGIDFINVPTTLLSQVDASVGGKTGINFNGLKNEVGTFSEPQAVIINTRFLSTIDAENLKSGFAEMIKHGLIHSPGHYVDLQNFDLENVDYERIGKLIEDSVSVKSYFVSNDLTENNIRKALNFGHTVGHAFESLAMEQERPILHGHAVAYGMIVELYLSHKTCNYNKEAFMNAAKWLTSIYGRFEFDSIDYPRLYELMTHDKKNEAGKINFTLIPETGQIAINQNCEKDLIFEALDFLLNF